MTDHPTATRRPVISVRVRLVVAIVISVAVGLLAVGATVYLVERAGTIDQIDQRLEDNLASARYLVSEGLDGRSWTSSEDALDAVVQRMSPDDNTGVVGVWGGEAQRVPGVPLDLDLVRDAPGFIDHVVALTDDAGAVIGATYAEEGVRWRYLAVPIEIPDSPAPASALFVMAFDIDAELAEINDARDAYLAVSAIVIVAVGVIAGIVAGRLLRPLRLMRTTAERVSAQSLGERLPVEGRDDVSQLAGTMNDMLDRLDTALESQKQLLSDVRHELRTPLTIVRGHLELMDPTDPRDVRETQALALDELDRMSELVKGLSEAAALHGPSPVHPVAVDVADLTAQIVRKAGAIVGSEVTAGPAAETVAVLDPARVTQAMLQLAQNGVTHGGGRLVIGSTLAEDRLEMWVRDAGPGVPADARSTIFERFTRGPGAEAPGSGLGLNIVQMIAQAHGGEALVRDARPGPGSVFVLSLPTPGARPPASPPTGHGGVPPRPPLPGAGGGVPTAPTATATPSTRPSGERPWHPSS
ncbi:ATP-binding protein [Microbacterium excoecariae]|uniref:ATP-binding protein n=1 Tax=Microbacterium excoecariae TaxID=2715210 RepID=UPI00140DA3AD|nr:HAMP domain-containing histidine kinase [Microbacterium excoecariae]